MGLAEKNKIVDKVRELMVTLDHVKKYRALSSSLRKFALISGGSIIFYILFLVFLVALSSLSLLSTGASFSLSLIFLAVPAGGVISGIVYVGQRMKSVETGVWKRALSEGLPGAIELLSRIDWEKELDEISDLRSITLQYSLAKLSSYSIVVLFAASFVVGPASGGIAATIGLILAISMMVSFAIGGRDVLIRYRESQSLDSLLRELRSFHYGFERSEFEIT